MLAFVAFHLPLASLFDVHNNSFAFPIRTLTLCIVVIQRITEKQSKRKNCEQKRKNLQIDVNE